MRPVVYEVWDELWCQAEGRVHALPTTIEGVVWRRVEHEVWKKVDRAANQGPNTEAQMKSVKRAVYEEPWCRADECVSKHFFTVRRWALPRVAECMYAEYVVEPKLDFSWAVTLVIAQLVRPR